MRKEYLIVLILLLSIEIAYAVPAPFDEYYYNPETKECINHWRGDEFNDYPVPEGFYFSGRDDVNCTQFNFTQFNMAKYEECKSLGGKYLMQNLTTYYCYIETEQMPTGGPGEALIGLIVIGSLILLFIIISIVIIGGIAIIIYFIIRKKKVKSK